jgi:hypothetical protein
MAIAGDRSGEEKSKLPYLVAEIESLAETDPDKALSMLVLLDEKGLDPIERLGLDARISSIKARLLKGRLAVLVTEIESLAETDPDKARSMLGMLDQKGLDPVERLRLDARIITIKAKLLNGRLADLVAEIESLAETDPEKARSMLGMFDQKGLDPVERLRLDARITAVKARVVSASISDVRSSLNSVEEMLGGPVYEYFMAGKLSVQDNHRDRIDADAAFLVREKIDQSAELPKVRAKLSELVVRVDRIGKLELSEQQATQLAGLKTEIEILCKAVK